MEKIRNAEVGIAILNDSQVTRELRLEGGKRVLPITEGRACRAEESAGTKAMRLTVASVFEEKQGRTSLFGQVVNTSLSKVEGAGLIPGQGVKILHALQPKKQAQQNVKQKQYCNKCNKNF